MTNQPNLIKDRFRGFLPVVVDVETAGFNADTNALIEIAIATLKMDKEGIISVDQTIDANVIPFKGSKLDKASLDFIGVQDPTHPFRMAVTEEQALNKCFEPINKLIKETACSRAILVGHNSFFDLSFLKAASARTKIKLPFHEFSTLDTVSLSALAYGQTVLSKAIKCADIEWDNSKAHSAKYDTIKTAELFCNIVNKWAVKEELNN